MSPRFARLLTLFVAVVLGTTAAHAEPYTPARILETPGGNPYGFGYTVDGDGCAANCANSDGPLELRRVRIHRGFGGPTGTGSVFVRG